MASININGRLISLDNPRVMGVINVTPDSFFRGSRYEDIEAVITAVSQMLEDGADFIDIGGCSTRPGAPVVPVEDEKKRVLPVIKAISGKFPGAVISVDTFRAEVAKEAVCNYGAHMINDISGGGADDKMFTLIKELNVPYVLMHMQGTPETMQINPVYDDVVADILKWFGKKIVTLHSEGVKDIILDPGFGFGKTVENNYEILRRLREFSVAGLPLMAGLSRKSMIWKTLNVTPEDSLAGTIAVNTIALLNGANILRVHDVKEAKQAIRIVTKLLGKNGSE